MTNLTNSGDKAMNNTAKVSAMSQVLFSKGLMPVQAVALSAALIELKEKVGHKNWEKVMSRTLRTIPFTVDGVQQVGAEIEGWLEALVSSNLITIEDGVTCEGPYLLALYEEKAKAYPRLASEGVVERRRKLKNSCEGMVSAIKVVEATEYTHDVVMVKLALQAYAKLGKGKLTSEKYVIEGAMKMIKEGNLPCVSEFFDDNRGRVYQGDGHGANGQASDMARAFMDLHGVSTDYDAELAAGYIMAEMSDMCSLSEDEILAEVDKIKGCTFSELVDYTVTHIRNNRSPIKKVWSFIKAAGLLIKLGRGDKPVIGMAFGLDAKCSGPQLAALMTDDEALAEACGFTSEEVDDAYERAIQQLNSSWTLERNDIKKPFMATFYGQSWQALTISANYGNVKKSDMEMAVLDCMLNGVGITRDTNPDMVVEMVYAHWDERAKEMAKAIEDSFGKVSNLRKAVKDAHGYWTEDMEGTPVWVALTTKATTHSMPDGVKVRMPYFTTVDINGVAQEFGMVAPDVELTLRGEDMKFNMITFKTKNVDLARHGRAGFVNMIQATDAQLARCIIRNLDSLGADHVISVHDCFRVNINDMISGKLEEAIKMAYLELFSTISNERTLSLPRGTDITGMYFAGVNKSRTKPGYVHSQFEEGERTLCDFMDMEELINDLGDTTYFAK